MTHKKYKKFISLYFDQALSPSDQEKLKEHLVSCSDCQSYLEKMKLIQKEVVSQPGVELSPADIQEARTIIIKRLSQEQVNRHWAKKENFGKLIKRRWQWVMPIFLIIVGSLLYYQFLKKTEIVEEPYGPSLEAIYQFLNERIEGDDDFLVSFNNLIEQAIAEVALIEVDYSFLTDYFYLAIEALQEDEKEGLSRLLFESQQEDSLLGGKNENLSNSFSFFNNYSY
ncbi:MAG: zf-HC2 domain-containing protein [Candidatus Aminicenantes bacterium]|nr:zf-HC2 domain-containing protein [Candidatus Aminicenantes bacterium]